jgi:hypothetical protein
MAINPDIALSVHAAAIRLSVLMVAGREELDGKPKDD